MKAKIAMNFFTHLRTRSFRRNLLWFVMCLPALVWIFIFKYLTMAGVSIAFLDYKPRRGIFGSDFIGLENFEYLFSTDIALRALRNTVLLNLLFNGLGINRYLANFIAIAVVTIWNFWVNLKLSWRVTK